MKLKLFGLALALVTPAALSATTVINTVPASAAHSCSAITFTGATATSCAGGYTGNLLKGSLDSPGLAALLSLGYVGDGTFLEKIEAPENSHTIDFTSLLSGDTFIGIHYGGGGGGGGKNNNATSFFRLSAGSSLDSFTMDNNGLSNYVLFATAAVPEPSTWAMLILGFGMVGGAMRTRAKVSKVAFA